MNDFQSQKQSQLEGVQYNAKTSQKKYTVLNFKFDSATYLGDNVWRVNFPIKSFWVRTATKGFSAKIKLNPAVDEGDALPLGKNMNLSYDYPQAGAAFEWPAQANGSMQIVFAHDSDIDVGLIENELAAEFLQERLALPDATILTVPSAGIQALAYNENRDHALIVWNPKYDGTNSIGEIQIFDKPFNFGTNPDPIAKLRAGEALEWPYISPLYLRMYKSSFDIEVKVFEVIK